MKKVSLVLMAGLMSVTLAGCLNYPVSEQRGVDQTPRIAFEVTSQTADGVVYVDGIAQGKVSDYRAGKAALRVTQGTHLVVVKLPSGQSITRKVFVSDGALSTIVLQ